MRRTNPIWFAAIGVLVVVLVGVLAFALWPRQEAPPSPEPPASTPPAPSPSASDPAPPPTPTSPDPSGWGGDPEADPEFFGGYPPPEVFEPLFEGKVGNIEPPPTLAGFTQDPDYERIHDSFSQGRYRNGDRYFDLVLDTSFGSYTAMMDLAENHRIVGISVCGDLSTETVGCATGSEDADITITSPVPGAFTDVALDEVLQEVIAHYRAN